MTWKRRGCLVVWGGMRLLLLSLVLAVAGCSSPSVSSSPSCSMSTAPLPAASPAESSAAAPPPSAPQAKNLNPEACEMRGLPVLEPCPGGGEWADDDLSESMSLPFCCGAGEVGGAERQSCFVALQAARSCKDAAGERAALARIDAYARKFGEPCKDADFMRTARGAFQRFLKICAERGFR